MVGIQSFPFGTMGRPIFRCKLAATLLGTNISHRHFEDDFPFLKVGYVSFLEGSFSAPCQLYTIFSQGETQQEPNIINYNATMTACHLVRKKMVAYEVWFHDFLIGSCCFGSGWFFHFLQSKGLWCHIFG